MNPSPTSWYHEQDGVARGPFTPDEMRARFQSGAFRPDTLVWHPELPRWLSIAASQPDWSLANPESPAPAPSPSVPSSPVTANPSGPIRKSLFSRILDRWLRRGA